MDVRWLSISDVQSLTSIDSLQAYPLVNFAGADSGLTTSPGVLSKTSGSDSWDSKAWTSLAIESRSSPRRGVAFRCSTTGHQMIGLGHGAPKTLTDWKDIDYLLYCDNPETTGTPDIPIDGGHIKGVGAYTAYDVFSIVLLPDGSIGWYKNTTLLHKATPSSLSFPLYVEASVLKAGTSRPAFMDVRWLSISDVHTLLMLWTING